MKEQTRAFLDGFNEVVPLEWLRYFDEKELEVRRWGGYKNRAVMTLELQQFHGLEPFLSGFILLPFSHSSFFCSGFQQHSIKYTRAYAL